MFISPGEISRGQWLMIHSTIEKETALGEENPFAAMGMVVMQAIDIPSPHLVVSVQLPFVVVADCVQPTPITKIWRTDEKKLIEVKPEFVQAYDINGWHRGQKLLDATYQVPQPPPRRSV